jgi:hypothetical protein
MEQAPPPVDRYEAVRQYSLGQILAVWAAAAVPMGVLALGRRSLAPGPAREDLRDLGHRMILRVRFHGHGVASDVPMSRTMWQVGESRHGRIRGWRFVTSEAEALQAVGLSE